MFTYQRKYMFPLSMDLQLFADKSATVDGQTFEIDESDAADDSFAEDDDVLDDINVDDDADDEEGVDSDGGDDEKGDSSTEGDEGAESDSDASNDEKDEDGKADTKGDKGGAKDNPVAKAVIAERRKMQARIDEANKKGAAAEKLMKMLGIDNPEELEARLDAAEAQRISKASNGAITPEQAQAQIAQQRKIEQQDREIRKLKYSQEVSDLKRDAFFADIEDYREEFEEVAERTGLSLKEVYMAKRGDVRMKEYEREVEQRTIANRNKRQQSKVDTAANGEQVQKPKHNLTPDQLAMAKAAVKMGTIESIDEYAKYMKKR
jgi:hypothetical protein